MVPTTWLGVVFFLVLIAPGLLFDMMAARRRVAPPESAFREAGRVVIASLGFDAFAFLVLVAVQKLFPRLVPDPAAMLRGGAAFVADRYNQVLGTIIGFAMLALGAALVVHLLFVAHNGAPTRPDSEWTRLFHHIRPKGTLPTRGYASRREPSTQDSCRATLAITPWTTGRSCSRRPLGCRRSAMSPRIFRLA